MTKTLVIGAGGVGSVAIHKMAMCPDVFGTFYWQAAVSPNVMT